LSQNRLFAASKPSGVTCSRFLSQIKKKYSVKKAGYSGTLDPFAEGVLIVAFGQYTKLFRFLDKTPKKYEATLWLGAKSETLDIERVESVDEVTPFEMEELRFAASKLKGTLTYRPPKFSAKKIDGKRSYELAREGRDVELKEITTEVYELLITGYEHPFVTFEATVSEGGYIRSIGKMMAELLGVEGCLKQLRRLNEGAFFYDDEKALDPLRLLNIKENVYTGDKEDIMLGRVLKKEDFILQEQGEYFIKTDDFLSVLKIDESVEYLLNKIELC
jgi:tRNA pseudouridine55 synthase